MTVHILSEGRTLCGMPGLPGDWPAGHRWVHRDEWADATCLACLAAEPAKPVSKFKTYLGDGAYADFDGYMVILTTENGLVETNRVCLEPEVFDALLAFFERLLEEHARVLATKT